MQNGRPVEDIGSLAFLWGGKHTPIDPETLSPFLIGAEGEGEEGAGEGSGDGGSGDGAAGQTPPPESTDPPPDDEGDKGKDSFSREYVEKLRKENAETRVKAKALEEELSERKKAEMSELEKAQTEAAEEKTAREAAEAQLSLMQLELAVTNAAAAANFHDPQDAMSLLNGSDISRGSDGTPNKQSVEAAVKRLAEAKPHLVKAPGAGSGDGGARGKGGAKVEDAQAEYQKQFQQSGGVPRPVRR